MVEKIPSMLVEEFLQLSKNTMPSESSLKDDLYHGAVGVATEVYEFKKAFTLSNQIEELGDASFYLALMHRRYPFAMFGGRMSSDSKDYIVTLLEVEVMGLLDAVKAHNEYGADNAIPIQRACSKIGAFINLLAKGLGYSIERVMAINYLKLQGPGGRYEGGFSNKKALSRDLKKESKILEDNS